MIRSRSRRARKANVSRPARSKRRLRLERLERRELLAGDVCADIGADVGADVGADIDRSQFLVRFEADAIENGRAEALLEGTKLGESLDIVPGLFEVHVADPAHYNEALSYYASAEGVAYAQPDFQIELQATPNDPFYGNLYGLQRIGAPAAWDATTGSHEIVVGVIDTGIDWDHPDLAANIWTNSDEIPGNGRDDDGNGFVDDVRGWDFVNNDNNPDDDNFHGTHVAGTIGAVGNNGIGVTGVNWNVKLMPLKFLSARGSGSTSNAIRALDYARENGAQITNNSWGGGGFSRALSDAIERYRQAGGVFVAAAGNAGRNNDVSNSFPANYSHDNVVSVAASDSRDRLASFSNYGVNSVDIAAPGVSILSTANGNRYGYASGTSMAAPHVAGAIALVWSQQPDLNYQEVIAAVMNSADPILLSRVKYGRLNLANAIAAEPPVDVEGPRVVSADWSGNGNALSQIEVRFNESIDVSSFTEEDIVLSGPDGPIAVTGLSEVTGSGATRFQIEFAQQSQEGDYQVAIGPQITDTSGNLMNQDGDDVGGELDHDVFNGSASISGLREFSWTGSRTIRDARGWWSRSTTVSLDVAENLTIDDLDVRVSIQHTWVSDLRLTLIGPDGRRQTLFYRRGGSGDDIRATFDDQADQHIARGRAPFEGSFRPERPLSVFNNAQTAGRWRLQIRDYAPGDRGRITEFSLLVKPAAGGSSVHALSVGDVRLVDALVPGVLREGSLVANDRSSGERPTQDLAPTPAALELPPQAQRVADSVDLSWTDRSAAADESAVDEALALEGDAAGEQELLSPSP